MMEGGKKYEYVNGARQKSSRAVRMFKFRFAVKNIV